MSLVIQVVAAALAVAFIAFLGYAALTDGHRRPAPRPARRAQQRRGRTGAEGRAGGAEFRRDALVAADDPLLGPANEEEDTQ